MSMSVTNRRDRRRAPNLDVGAPMRWANGFAAGTWWICGSFPAGKSNAGGNRARGRQRTRDCISL